LDKLKIKKNRIFLTFIYYFEHNPIHSAFNKPQSHIIPITLYRINSSSRFLFLVEFHIMMGIRILLKFFQLTLYLIFLIHIKHPYKIYISNESKSYLLIFFLHLAECLHSWWGMIFFLIIPIKPLPIHFISILTSFNSNSIAIKTIKLIPSLICLGRNYP
jgi:hypothetical protein